jgi:hypothetical protein
MPNAVETCAFVDRAGDGSVRGRGDPDATAGGQPDVPTLGESFAHRAEAAASGV